MSKTHKTRTVYTVREGSAQAKVYFTPKTGRASYTLVYRNRNNVRQRKVFTTMETARQEGRNLLRQQLQGCHDAAVLTDTDRLMVNRANKALGEIGNVPLDLAILDYVKAIKLLDGTPLADAVNYYRRMRPTGNYNLSVEEVVQKLLADRRSSGASKSYLRSLGCHLGRFQAAFRCSLISVSPDQVAQHVHALGGGDINRKNRRNAIGLLFNFAKKRGYLPLDHLGAGETIKVRHRNKGEMTIFSPDELSGLIKVASLAVLPALVIGAFAGLRTEEIARLDWGEVHLDRELIEVKAEKSKTGRRRLVPIQPNLLEWLKLLHMGSGPVADYKNLGNKFWKIAKYNGLEWRRNGLRHSWISYRVSQTGNVHETSLAAGNSAEILRGVYLEAADKATACAWFSITPESIGWKVPQSK